MGPIALYDKSFLQGLNVDEAVMFDWFFYPVTCPIFYVETLADLEKNAIGSRSPEQVVGSLALKTPQMHGGPNVHHRTLAIYNLLGKEIPMVGQIVVAGGQPNRADGRNNVVFKRSPEAEAFSRWQRGEFEELERSIAKIWRAGLRIADLNAFAQRATRYGLNLDACKNSADAKRLAEEAIGRLDVVNQMAFALDHLQISDSEKAAVLRNWAGSGNPPLAHYAPYAYFVLLVQVFFEIALATGKIDRNRPSNINDLAYLFYLPFCMVFISSDRLHRMCAPLFMREDQQFLWGIDIKEDLKRNNEKLLELPEQQRLRGLMVLSPSPCPGMIRQIYDRHLKSTGDKPLQILDAAAEAEVEERFRKIRQAAPIPLDQVDFSPNEADSITIERLLQKKRGSWYQVPHDLQPQEEK